MNDFFLLMSNDTCRLIDLFFRLIVNTFFTFIIAKQFYYPKSRRKDFFLTYVLVGFGIFMLIHLMGDAKLKTGIAMGLFAIFCIMRYRTESVPIREMTYLFLIISMAAINGLAWTADVSGKHPDFFWPEMISMTELIVTNCLFIVAILLSEGRKWVKSHSTKYIKYDKINLITPEKHNELIADLKARTGLDITGVSIGSIDFLKDMALLKVYYDEADTEDNNDDTLQKMPKIYE